MGAVGIRQTSRCGASIRGRRGSASPRILPASPRWAEANGRKAGDLGEPLFELVKDLLISLCLVGGQKDALPNSGQVTGITRWGVELHRAAEGIIALREGKIVRLKLEDVPKHFGFAVVGVEDGMGQKWRLSIVDCRLLILI